MPAMTAISAIHHMVYPKYVISNCDFDLYIIILLPIRARIDDAINIKVLVNVADLPKPNQAVSENGIYIFRYTMAKRTENVTVPISWYFPSRYDGNFLFISGTNVKLFASKYKA